MIQQTVFPRSEWAKEVKKMCNYTCAHCGKRSETKEMHAHHIVPRSESDDLACVLENGVALCSTCHRILHFGGGGGISECVKEIAERSIIISLPKGQKAAIEAAADAAGEIYQRIRKPPYSGGFGPF